MNKNPYNVLGIPEEASFKEIQRAFRIMAIKYHPDKNPNNKNAADVFITIIKAYEFLKNKRNAQNKEIKRKGSDISTTASVSIEALIRNSKLSFYIERKGLCKTCDGTGSINKKTRTCVYCNGSGLQGLAKVLGQKKRCMFCDGYGIIPDGDKCSKCKGKAVLSEKVRHEITLNPLSYVITIPGAGNYCISGEPGNLIVNLDVKNNSEYRINSLNIVRDVDISPTQAIIGDILSFYAFDKKIEVKIPPGTKNKDSIILYNQGLSYEGKTGYFKALINIVIPVIITEEEFNLYTEILKLEKESTSWPKVLKI